MSGQTIMELRDELRRRRCDADNVLDEIHQWCDEHCFWGLNIHIQTHMVLPDRIDVEIDAIEGYAEAIRVSGETLAGALRNALTALQGI